MIEIIKEAGVILKDLPDLAIWILVGILFYKVVIVGSIFGIAKLGINKTTEILTKPKVVEKRLTIDGHFIKHDGTYDAFMSLIRDVGSHDGSNSNYIHKRHVSYLHQAYKEKKARDSKNESN